MSYSLAEIGDALRTSRLQLDKSQRDLSELTGISQARISLIENGAVDLRTSTLQELARSLDLEVVLVPRRTVEFVTALARDANEDTDEDTPLYQLDDTDG